MTYAPVCIPTLNRYEHLRKCLESLSRCTWAEHTEVYVALDYPPTNQWDKYALGWEKNRDWLRSIGDFGFKKLHLIEREENYGIWLPGHKGNSRCLIKEQIMPNYDRYIFSEDDNVFAPCFLEYMNKGLEKFENDNKVYSIGGYKFFYPIKVDENTFIRQTVDYSPWGVGRWTKKQCPELNYLYFRQHLSWTTLMKLHKDYGWASVANILSKSCKPKQQMAAIDNDVWTYMQITGSEQITPTITLVENIGLDGSGMDMPESMDLEWTNPKMNPLSTDTHFEFIGSGYEYQQENLKIYYHGKYWRSYLYYFIKTLKKMMIYVYRSLHDAR